jgi:hypothetical protein
MSYGVRGHKVENTHKGLRNMNAVIQNLQLVGSVVSLNRRVPSAPPSTASKRAVSS